ncbi:membrane protein insertase YidC [Actinophytocola sediminis]
MFDFLLYPVSAVLWFWHNVFGAVIDPNGGLAWVLGIVFLVFTVRALLVGLALRQHRAAGHARLLAPKVRRIRERHGADRARMAREIQRLHADAGTSPLAGCLPALIQIPVFLSLFWVLRGFAPGAHTNQVFDQAGVASFLNADVWGARLGNWFSQPMAELAAVGTDKAHLLGVGLPLVLLAGLATFLSIRTSLRRQDTDNPQLAVVSRVLMYLAPIGLVASAWLFPMPIGVLVYLATSNVWTFAQQQILARVEPR